MLTGEKVGDNAQALALARRIGWPYEIRRLRWNAGWRLHNLLLGASLLSLDRRKSDPLAPPWPDLVIGVGRRSVSVSRWIRRQSRGHTKLVRIGRPRAPLAWFDLVITTPQYGLPGGRNLLQLSMPFPEFDSAHLAEAAAEWRPRLAHLPRPWLALLIGGDAKPYGLTVPMARALADLVNEEARRAGGSVIATTSRRTPGDAAAAIADGLKVSHYLHRWSPSAVRNPYAAFVALADRFFVTFDSASMLAEAIATGKPVTAVPLPIEPASPLQALTAWRTRRRARASAPRPYGRLRSSLVRLGLAKPPRDLGYLYQALLAQRAVLAPGAEAKRTDPPLDELTLAAERVKALFETHL